MPISSFQIGLKLLSPNSTPPSLSPKCSHILSLRFLTTSKLSSSELDSLRLESWILNSSELDSDWSFSKSSQNGSFSFYFFRNLFFHLYSRSIFLYFYLSVEHIIMKLRCCLHVLLSSIFIQLLFGTLWLVYTVLIDNLVLVLWKIHITL